MDIQLGYACINTQLGGFKSYQLSDLNKPNKVEEIKRRIIYNFSKTLDVIKWNESNNIKLYRMTSELVPLATHPSFIKWQQDVNWYWFEDPVIHELMGNTKEYVERNNHWITLHPGQYTVLNSNKDEVVNKSIKDLEYHYYLMYYLGGRGLVIHVGGVYGDKQASIKRWKSVYKTLPKDMQEFIYLENDDKSYTVKDIINIYKETGVKPLIDFHHWRCNPTEDFREDLKFVCDIWGEYIKIHLSSGKNCKEDRSHNDLISIEDFQWMQNTFKEIGYKGLVWCMLESKSKEQSLLNLKGRIQIGEI